MEENSETGHSRHEMNREGGKGGLTQFCYRDCETSLAVLVNFFFALLFSLGCPIDLCVISFIFLF